jgi:PAS domain S-box-containing protein
MQPSDESGGRADDQEIESAASESGGTGLGSLDELIELAPAAVIVRTFDDVITYWSRGAEELYGWSRAEAIGQVTHALLHTVFPASRQAVDESLEKTGRWNGELVHTRRDGTTVVVASRQAVRRDQTGRPVAIVQVNTDITEHMRVEDDLRASEERFRLLVESVQDYAIYMLSPEGIVMSWNEGAMRLKGYLPDEILGQSFTRFYPPDDVARRVPYMLLERAAAEGRVTAEGWRVRKDGTRFWADIVITALRDKEGRLRGFAKVTRDVTARRQAEEDRARAQREEGARIAAEALQAELRVSRDQLAAILAGVAEGITVQDATGRVIYANDAAARLIGFPDAAAFLNAPRHEIYQHFKVFDEAGAPLPLDQLPGRKVLRDEPAAEIVVQFRPPETSELRWSLLNATPIRDSNGKPQLAVNIFHDITERRRAEETARFLAAAGFVLAQALDYEHTLQEVARLAVPTLADWCVVDIVDDDGQIRRLAAAHSDPAKVQLAEELSRRYPIDPNASDGLAQILRTGRAELAAEITDAQLAASVGDPEYLRILRSLQIRSALTVPLLARGRVLGAITLIHAESGRHYTESDLTVAENLAVRAALAIDNARLYREARVQADTQVELNAALRDAMGRLQDVLRTREEFLAAASHDLKNPIASIKGLAQLSRRRLQRSDRVDLAQIREDLTRIDAIASRASGMVEGLLDIARLQMGQPLDLNREPTDLVELTRDLVAEHQRQTDRHQIRLETDLASAVGQWDSNRLTRAIGNLLDNAVKYSPRGGTIQVRVTQEPGSDEWISVMVQDEGVGIAPDDLERIFDRFQRGSNVVGVIPGTGIGFTSVRHIVAAHGGLVQASSEPGRGTTFTIRLPLGASPEPETEIVDAVAEGTQS